jgi:hypothetical protein
MKMVEVHDGYVESSASHLNNPDCTNKEKTKKKLLSRTRIRDKWQAWADALRDVLASEGSDN